MGKCTRNSDTSIVADSNCKLTKPNPVALSCNMGNCPPPYNWKELWGPCSAACGKGMQGSYYKCFMKSSNTEMSDSYCEGINKSTSVTRECTTVCSWTPTYGCCLPKCGSGYKFTMLQCQNDVKKNVDISNCDGSSVSKVNSVACNAEPCKEYAPEVVDIPKIYAIGCYKDNPYNRHLPVFIANFRSQIDWKDMSKTVISCARKATSYKYFGIQFYGECWASNSEKYFLSGTSTNCYMGTGGERTNYVYTFTGPARTPSLP